MIFVTVGTQLPFDRMIRAVDAWAAGEGRNDVFAQVGNTTYRPEHIACKAMLEPNEFYETLASASLIISHAGMGSIISAIELGKPIIVVPRKAALGEHRNDHQLATARSFQKSSRVTVAFDETELVEKLRRLDLIVTPTGTSTLASAELIYTIRDAIHQPETPRRRFWLWRRDSAKSREVLQ